MVEHQAKIYKLITTVKSPRRPSWRMKEEKLTNQCMSSWIYSRDIHGCKSIIRKPFKSVLRSSAGVHGRKLLSSFLLKLNRKLANIKIQESNVWLATKTARRPKILLLFTFNIQREMKTTLRGASIELHLMKV